MNLIAFFLSTSVVLLFDSPCLADGFSDPVDHDNVRFSQYQTEELHQEPVLSPDGNTLAYIHVEDENITKRRLWVMDADGGNQRPLIVDPVPHIQAYPRWSPDGRYIAYVSDHGGDGTGLGDASNPHINKTVFYANHPNLNFIDYHISSMADLVPTIFSFLGIYSEQYQCKTDGVSLIEFVVQSDN